MRLAWLTDLHLNFIGAAARRAFYQNVLDARPDAVIIGGDIAEGPSLVEQLAEIEAGLQPVPVYFVLGNHDFYHSSFELIRKRIQSPRWLTHAGVQLLSEATALIGDDGWADGRLGDYGGSRVLLNDYFLIGEFIGLGAAARLQRLHKLGDAAAKRIAGKLREACKLRPRVVLLTHVPPFLEACCHEGRRSDEHWLPHFSSKAMGDAILGVMDKHPDVQLLVLCGHTHSSAVAQMRPNVLVKTGAAEYGIPVVQEVFEA